MNIKLYTIAVPALSALLLGAHANAVWAPEEAPCKKEIELRDSAKKNLRGCLKKLELNLIEDCHESLNDYSAALKDLHKCSQTTRFR